MLLGSTNPYTSIGVFGILLLIYSAYHRDDARPFRFAPYGRRALARISSFLANSLFALFGINTPSLDYCLDKIPFVV